jgi:hypothetical protein
MRVLVTNITGFGLDDRIYTSVEAGSNTSTVTMWVMGGDEKGSLKSERVKYGHESVKDSAGKNQQHIQNTDPSSRQRGRPTETRL